MAQEQAPSIGDLALIGDRRTGALVGRRGEIVWYCPGRFDRPSLLGALLDPKSGSWRLEARDASYVSRRYAGPSAILETCFAQSAGELLLTDWMNAGDGAPRGVLCRLLSPAPADLRLVLEPRPDYARRAATLVAAGPATVRIDDGAHWLYGSHPIAIDGQRATIDVPAGERAWAALADSPLPAPSTADVFAWRQCTLDHWQALEDLLPYEGPYAAEIAASLRAIRLLTHAESGGILAAATASLPEVAGGSRNWDYRYVWLRDAGMVVSALVRLGGDLTEGARYLDFICSLRGASSRYPVPVFATLDGQRAPEEAALNIAGYAGSRPVRVGNDARDQLQLDALANIVLAAKLIYGRTDERPHWATVQEIAEFLAARWHEPDHGIWEEKARRQYTASKVIAACALASAAEYSADPAQAARWRSAVRDIRTFVAENCLTAAGAYAHFARTDEVDVSAVLFPIWAYTSADAPEMVATIAELDLRWSWQRTLYWRRLECDDSRAEGAFLASSFWMAQYWVMRGDLLRAREIIDAALECANDVGLFAEEYDPRRAMTLGNTPQAFVHAALIGAVIDLKVAS